MNDRRPDSAGRAGHQALRETYVPCRVLGQQRHLVPQWNSDDGLCETGRLAACVSDIPRLARLRCRSRAEKMREADDWAAPKRVSAQRYGD